MYISGLLPLITGNPDPFKPDFYQRFQSGLSASLAASKATGKQARRRGRRTHIQPIWISRRSGRQMKLQMLVTGPNRLLGAWEMLALLEYIYHP